MECIDVGYLPIWKRYLELFRKGKLADQDIGALVRAMMEYQFEGEITGELSDTLSIYWMFIQEDLDHARQQYETSVKNGRKGGRKKASGKASEPEETRHNPTEGKSITESIPESESISITKTKTNTESKQNQSPPACAGESVSLSNDNYYYGEYGWVRLSKEDYTELERYMGTDALKRCITYIDESAQSTGNRNNWMDWRLVLRRCYQKRWYEADNPKKHKPDIPKGASGVLGEAELEAIRRVLHEE